MIRMVLMGSNSISFLSSFTVATRDLWTPSISLKFPFGQSILSTLVGSWTTRELNDFQEKSLSIFAHDLNQPGSYLPA